MGIHLPDVILGLGPSPRFVLKVIEGLPDTSLTAALIRGSYELYGWGRDRYMIADLFDAINQNTAATGNFKKPPKIKPYPRPDIKSKVEKKKVTVRDLYNHFSGMK